MIKKSIAVCFVCLGNICRSPTAEGVMHDLVTKAGLTEKIIIDSAGTSGYHSREKADQRSRMTAEKRGYRLGSLSRKFIPQDFDRFDYIIAMDRSNAATLRQLARTQSEASKIFLFRDFDPASPKGLEVPDPYYGGHNGFNDVLDICEAGCRGLLQTLQKQLQTTV